MELTKSPARILLVLKKSSSYEASILRALGGAQESFLVERMVTLKTLSVKSKPGMGDLLVAGLDVAGLRRKLQAGVGMPVVLLVNPRSEKEALELLEDGAAADYVLTTQAQLRRLPFVLKSVLARTRQTERLPERGGQVDVLRDAVYQIAAAADQADSLDSLLPQIHKIIAQVMPAENFYISLYDPDQNVISYPYFVDEVEILPETSFKV